MNGSTTPGSQGLCPTGWHIPTDAEYCTLEQQICSDIGNTGCATTFDCVNTGWHGQNTTTGEGEGSAMAGYEAKWTDNDIDNWGLVTMISELQGFLFLRLASASSTMAVTTLVATAPTCGLLRRLAVMRGYGTWLTRTHMSPVTRALRRKAMQFAV